MTVNVKGVWFCMKHQIPAMLKSGGGSIVNTSPFSGATAFATIPIYAANKYAVVGVTKAVALDQIATIHPIGRLATTAVIAYTVIFLCSEKATFITGQLKNQLVI